MRKYSKLKRYSVNKLYRNERFWKTKKAKKAFRQIGFTMLLILSVNELINTVQAKSQEPEVWVFENENIFSGIQENRQDNLSDKESKDNGNDGTGVENAQYGEARVTTNHQLSVASSEKTKGSTSQVEELIKEKFQENSAVVSAVFKAESGHRADAMGWNCRYTRIVTGKNGEEIEETYSTSCKPEDRYKAWSVDCGVAQINVIGKTCPEELFDPENNLNIARKMYESRGLSPWVAWVSGAFKKHL